MLKQISESPDGKPPTWSLTTAHARVKLLNNFLKWMRKKRYIDFKPIKYTVRKPMKEIAIRMPTEKQYLALMYNDTLSSLLPVKIAASMGLRKSEVFALRVRDVQYHKNKPFSIIVNKGKRGVVRMVPIPDALEEDIHKNCESKHEDELLVGKHTVRAQRRALRSAKIAMRSDFLYTYRDYRTIFATLAHQHGGSIHTISKCLGHANIATTTKFYTKICLHDIKNMVDSVNTSIHAAVDCDPRNINLYNYNSRPQ